MTNDGLHDRKLQNSTDDGTDDLNDKVVPRRQLRVLCAKKVSVE